MFILNHAATAYLVGTALGLSRTEAAIASGGASLNDIVPAVDFIIRKALGKQASWYSNVYDYFHGIHWPFVGVPIAVWLCGDFFGQNWIVPVVAAFIGFYSHIVIDVFWHFQEEPYGYKSWGIAADILVGLTVVLIGWLMYAKGLL